MSQVKLSALVKGLVSYAPGTGHLFCSGSGGTTSARYCYAVWMRHLIKAKEAGFDLPFERVAELGPGDSIGAGLCAVLCGANEYYAFDAKAHADRSANRIVLKALVQMIMDRQDIPDENEFPSLHPVLYDHTFPHHILTEAQLERSLSPRRLAAIERALQGETSVADVKICYIAPWQGRSLQEPRMGLDLVFSQAVMEHVEDVSGTYRELFRWLKPGGVMSHTIDYKSHGYARSWNGHWATPMIMWKIVRGRRPYLINRLPHSAQISAMTTCGFEIISESRVLSAPIARKSLRGAFRSMSEEDLMISGAFVQAQKPFVGRK